jgi:hypothetical protein
MNSHQQLVERKPPCERNHDLSVKNEFRGLQFRQRAGELRKIARERLARLRLQINFFTIAEGQAAEPIPLGLILPLGSHRKAGGRRGFHRFIFFGER